FLVKPMKETDDTYAVLHQRAETAERKVKAYEDAVGSLRGDFEETIKALRSDNHRLKTLLEEPGLKHIVRGYGIYIKKIDDPKRNLLLAIVEAFCMDHYKPGFVYNWVYTQFHMHT
ncbi:hypothetical protein HDU98_005385, partial [Podochytrium sp. JEL0797]